MFIKSPSLNLDFYSSLHWMSINSSWIFDLAFSCDTSKELENMRKSTLSGSNINTILITVHLALFKYLIKVKKRYVLLLAIWEWNNDNFVLLKVLGHRSILNLPNNPLGGLFFIKTFLFLQWDKDKRCRTLPLLNQSTSLWYKTSPYSHLIS